jgi:butyrate kinase
MSLILVINPGGGSTKVAVFNDDECMLSETIAHPHDEIAAFKEVLAQRAYREEAIANLLMRYHIDTSRLAAVVGRGGALKPLESGTYRVNQLLADDIKAGNVQTEHASNLGALIAFEIAEPLGKPSFMVDPVSVDEFVPEARFSGMPETERRSLDHPLNARMVARKAARELGGVYKTMNFIVAHLGTGISISAHEQGRIIDVNNAHDAGPFSTQRTGSLPVTQLIDLCFSGKYSRDEMFAKATQTGGLKAYLGTDDLAEVERLIAGGDSKAALVVRAMAYQIAKEIGAYATVLKGRVDAIVFTGGMAFSDHLLGLVRERVGFITANIFVYPGENEMESMALGALRVLRGEEEPKVYR